MDVPRATLEGALAQNMGQRTIGMTFHRGEPVYWQEKSVSDHRGHLELTGLPREQLRLVVEHPDYRDHPLTTPGEVQDSYDFGTVTLVRGATVEGRVALPEGEVLGTPRVEIFKSAQPMIPYRSTPISDDGTYRFSGLDAGQYALKAAVRLRKPRKQLTAIEKIELADREVLRQDLIIE